MNDEEQKQQLKLTIYDFISVNHYLTYRVVYSKGRAIPTSFKTREASLFQRNFSEYVKEEAKKQNWIMDEEGKQHYYVDAVFYFPRIDMDANNYFKVTLDAITESGVVWKDDNTVCERVQRIYYSSTNPRIEFTIYPVSYVGVFEDEEGMSEFEEKCKTCSRYGRNCSILKKIKAHYEMDEVIDGQCTKYKEKKIKNEKEK